MGGTVCLMLTECPCSLCVSNGCPRPSALSFSLCPTKWDERSPAVCICFSLCVLGFHPRNPFLILQSARDCGGLPALLCVCSSLNAFGPQIREFDSRSQMRRFVGGAPV